MRMRRRLARELALQSLYHIEMNEVSPLEAVQVAVNEAENDNEAELQVDRIEVEPVLELVQGTRSRVADIDKLLQSYLTGWRIERLSKVDQQILRLAVYEMVYRDDVPARVAINEAIELAKRFGGEESGKFVNGVLGKMIRELDELKAAVRTGQ